MWNSPTNRGRIPSFSAAKCRSFGCFRLRPNSLLQASMPQGGVLHRAISFENSHWGSVRSRIYILPRTGGFGGHTHVRKAHVRFFNSVFFAKFQCSDVPQKEEDFGFQPIFWSLVAPLCFVSEYSTSLRNSSKLRKFLGHSNLLWLHLPRLFWVERPTW